MDLAIGGWYLSHSSQNLKRARLWSLGEDCVVCRVCERRCAIKPGYRGVCGNYVNVDNALYHLGYGRLSAVESRPIEIKPLFHYWPNSTALTFSNWGCNFYCPWCQNHYLSFRKPSEDDPTTPPEELLRTAILGGDEGFSASFNEPTVNFDYIADLAELAVKEGLYFMTVTNGYLTTDAIDLLLQLGVDGWSIDVKGCPKMKRALAGVDHSAVYRNAKHIVDGGGHVEMVYLVVTNTNDFDECVEWIIDNHISYLGHSVPLHINRYYPAHRWREPPTPLEKLLWIAEKARGEGIEYTYIGNVGDPQLESTKCPKCGKTLIYRHRYRVLEFNLDRDDYRYRCSRCGYRIPITGRYIQWKSWIWF
ncbi:MAG: radical SAM protein [Ignisphaera sp.]|nr:radical SAM protein [Ignisphaera sp.]MDW8084847.1 radical SAM protein [Ignisphaera sp.]